MQSALAEKTSSVSKTNECVCGRLECDVSSMVCGMGDRCERMCVVECGDTDKFL